MARYTYNAGLVTQAVDKLYSACDALNNTNVDIQKGISTIYNARGAENINVDFSVITGYQSQVIEYIDMMSEEIRTKAQEIEEYQDAPWYKKLFATIGMGALKLVEGLASFVENIGDGLVSIAGFIGGIFSSEFKDSVAEFVKTDYVGDAFANAYETGWLQDVNKYSIMSHESTAANILKGVGTAAGYVILSVATAGAGTAVSLGVSTAAAGVGGIGSGTQSGLQAGMTFNQAFGQGVKQGAVAAGTTLLVGGLANKLGSLGKAAGSLDDAGAVLAGSADDVGTALAATGDDIINAGDDVLRAAGGAADDVINASDDVLKTATSFADDVASKLPEGSKVVGKAVLENGDEIVVAQNAAGKIGAIVKHGDDIGQLMTNNVDEIAAAVAKGGGVYDDIGGLLTVADDVTNVGAQTAAAVDDIVNAGSTSLTVVDDVANTGSTALTVVDDVANTGSTALTVVDDVANTGSTALTVVDDVANTGSTALTVVDDVANTGSTALTVVDDVATVTDDIVNVADDVAAAADDAVNAAKPNLAQRVVNKVDNVVTKFGTNTKVGQALSNVAAKAGPTVTNAVAAGTGAVVSGAVTDPLETSAYRVAVNEAATPTAGQGLYNDATTALENGIPTQATEEQAAQNLENLKNQGYEPGGETTVTTPTVTPTVTPQTYTPPTGGGNGGYTGGGTPTVTAPTYTPPSNGGGTPTVTAPTYTPPTGGETPEEGIVGGQNPTDPSTPTNPGNPSNPQTPNVGGITGNNPNYPGGGTGTNTGGISGNGSGGTGTVGSQVLDTFGDVSGSLSSLAGNSKTSIPTSSSPILSSDGTTSKSMLPLGAGLGAAALAGIGTKAFLDKKEKKEEDEDELNAEQWEEDANSVEVDYSVDTGEEADYLSPTDEYAFQE